VIPSLQNALCCTNLSCLVFEIFRSYGKKCAKKFCQFLPYCVRRHQLVIILLVFIQSQPCIPNTGPSFSIQSDPCVTNTGPSFSTTPIGRHFTFTLHLLNTVHNDNLRGYDFLRPTQQPLCWFVCVRCTTCSCYKRCSHQQTKTSSCSSLT
jgi:hypothetical protein